MLFLENGVNSVEKAANFHARREKKLFSRSRWRQILKAHIYVCVHIVYVCICMYIYENALWSQVIGITAHEMVEERNSMLLAILQR